MKGIIIEKNIDKSLLLLSDGNIITVKTASGLDIGSVVSVDDIIRTSTFYIKKLASMAASILLIVFLGMGVYAWKNPVQYINIDINPSVELSVNCFSRIISINSLNDEGWKLIKAVSLKADTYESGIKKIISSAKDLGYINEEGDILISISSNDMNLNERTQAAIREKITDRVEIMTFDTEEYILSAENGLSPGKNSIIEKVIESGANETKDALVDAPVKELIKKWDENKKNLSAAEKKEENKEVQNTEMDKQKAEEAKQKEEQKKRQEEEKKREEREKEELKQKLESQKAEAEKQKEEQKKKQEEEKKKEEREKEELKQQMESQKAEAGRQKEENKKKQAEEKEREEKSKIEFWQPLEIFKAQTEKNERRVKQATGRKTGKRRKRRERKGRSQAAI